MGSMESCWKNISKMPHPLQTQCRGRTLLYKTTTREFRHFANILLKILYDSHKPNADKKNLRLQILRLIQKEYTDPNCLRFCKRIRREIDMLFTFIELGTEWHNNLAERGVRPCVCLRKLVYCSRSEKDIHSMEIMMSIAGTARLQDVNLYDFIRDILRKGTSKS